MSKRKVNFGAITSEAARRQLMVPTPCWERVSVTPEDSAPGATWKVYKWVKTDRKQAQEEVDQPLAPLQEVEEIETNEEDTENAEDTPTGENSRAVSELPQAKDDMLSRPVTPKPHPLSISFQPPSPTPAPQEEENIEVDTEVLTATTTLDPGLGEEEINPDDIMHMNMTDLGPDGEPFEGAGSLLQVQEEDDLLGGAELMDQTGDPFQDI
ncbi:hypothetical protein BDM02DRAFT_3085772 [Thelephora ganbajun]|uniref:Uncharacterized protein n=1 Tax=Thelephora ganbajun TaxID=370292 RepID=A0ACB6ZX03_THEGA|nr:hypothetical protein BDM02DRAFT_3085772 [Thelephora ganbajun]